MSLATAINSKIPLLMSIIEIYLYKNYLVTSKEPLLLTIEVSDNVSTSVLNR